MNKSNSRRKKSIIDISFYVVMGIIAVAILFGVLYDVIVGETEKRTYPQRYSAFVTKYSADYGVPETVIYAVIKAESNFDKNAVSSADPPALGLMQLQEETYEWISSYLLKEEMPSPFDIYDPATNIKHGTRYLAYLYGRFENWDTAFAAYNAGPTKVSGWLEDPEYSDDGKTLKNIPYKETRNYVKKVNDFKEIYERLYYSDKK